MGRDYPGKIYWQPQGVSTHAPAWGATIVLQIRIFAMRFNPRARMGRDHLDSLGYDFNKLFQPTRPHGARPIIMHINTWGYKFQPTRPHGARHFHGTIVKSLKRFQPTRPHGARPIPTTLFSLFTWFQPTRPHGARPRRARFFAPSISFNPRARMGRDDFHGTIVKSLKRFQPTRPHGARLTHAGVPTPSPKGFNPRARMGRDLTMGAKHVDMVVSTHAPAWGATLMPVSPPQAPKVSTHAPAWGATIYPNWKTSS